MNLFHSASFVAVTQTVVLLMLINSKTAHSSPTAQRERLRLFHPYANTYQQMSRMYPNRHAMASFHGQSPYAQQPIYYGGFDDASESVFPEGENPVERIRSAPTAPPAAPATNAFWNKRNVLKKLALQGARGFGK
ncbi:hypothetical protein L596_022462 [Steinernema carpocapsae]|uniref:Uncharacterized protein n=1 Tax=Steinernema carpocapsae TaxID=34508 RepID=A0A4U5MM64_STECR|nr:hypothetical protein L596_022462 [Steinernema carpocapsae]